MKLAKILFLVLATGILQLIISEMMGTNGGILAAVKKQVK